MKFSALIPVSMFFLLTCVHLEGEEWAIMGARALGMGGANVAAATGAGAYYWNPGLYAVETHYDLQFPVGTGIAIEGDMLEKADFLADRMDALSVDTIQDTFNDFDTTPVPLTDSMFQAMFEILLVDIPPISGSGTGVKAHGGLGFELRTANFGAAGMGIAYGGAHPVVDLSVGGGVALSDDVIVALVMASPLYGPGNYAALSLEGQALSDYIDFAYSPPADVAATFVRLAEDTPPNPKGNTVDFTNPDAYAIFISIIDASFGNQSAPGTNDVMIDNISGADIGLIATREVAFTAARRFAGERLALGVNLKGVIADTYSATIVISEIEDGEGLMDEFAQLVINDVESRRLALDVGGVYALAENLWIGLTVRNLNQPTFEFDGDDNGFTLYAQTRAGIAYKPFESLTLAADLDLMPNLSEVIDGHKTQHLAAGLEWTPVSWYSLRTGLFKNLATSDTPTYTLGMGFNISHFHLDFAGAMRFSDIQVEYDELGVDEVYLPEQFNFMLSLGFDFDF